MEYHVASCLFTLLCKKKTTKSRNWRVAKLSNSYLDSNYDCTLKRFAKTFYSPKLDKKDFILQYFFLIEKNLPRQQ